MQKVIAFLIAVIIHTASLGQSVLGFWEVKEVKVGTRDQDPGSEMDKSEPRWKLSIRQWLAAKF